MPSAHFPNGTVWTCTTVKKGSREHPSNIAERVARRSNKVFIRFLMIAHGSIAEVESQLII
jgi:hypothetical protein